MSKTFTHISDYTLQKPIFISPTTYIYHSAKLMADHQVDILLLSSDDKTCDGVLTERDLVRGLGQKGPDFLSLRVRDIMLAKPLVCDNDKSMSYVLNLVVKHKIRHLPIEQEGEIIGVLGAAEIFKFMSKNHNFDFFS